ncbi:protein of unassigned function [Methylobacterium oryzae CBMB20]|uniref:Protein of unassigned function n=1 Tax=Methylobacterium oryzae CBMB20 TaxID=693986 RepID=A0A089P4Y8_9HYPH|nr:protein of unassigned function [Methylobacterium oryzae CBMB20]
MGRAEIVGRANRHAGGEVGCGRGLRTGADYAFCRDLAAGFLCEDPFRV